MIKKIILITLAAHSLLASTMIQAVLPDNFVASYTIKEDTKTIEMNYYRDNGVVAYEYPKQGATEIWTKNLKRATTLIRAFDKDQRAIEYDPIDLSMDNIRSNWNAHKNFMNPENFSFTSVSREMIDGVELVHYKQDNGNKHIDLLWDEYLDLLYSFEIRIGEKVARKYELTSLHKMNEEKNHILDVLAYKTTDYADIGDNESDPFFRKMINLGFIKHHEANIINAHGEYIGLNESHKH